MTACIGIHTYHEKAAPHLLLQETALSPLSQFQINYYYPKPQGAGRAPLPLPIMMRKMSHRYAATQAQGGGWRLGNGLKDHRGHKKMARKPIVCVMCYVWDTGHKKGIPTNKSHRMQAA